MADLRALTTALKEVPPERLQHGGFIVFEPVMVTDEKGEEVLNPRTRKPTPQSDGAQRLRFRDTCPLDAYLHRDLIDWRQHDAGCWLNRTYRSAVTPPRTTAAYRPSDCSGGSSDKAPLGAAAMTFRRIMLSASLAELDKLPDYVLTLRLRSGTEIIAQGLSGVRLTPTGHLLVEVCALEDWAGGTRRIAKLRDGLDALADALRITRKPRGA